jgi:serine/threonine protein kinase
MSFENDILVDGLYEIQETFEGGGMGLVHRAKHRIWNIEVAIKHPRQKFLRDAIQLANFYSECSTWAEIGLHPHVATCFYSREIEGLPCVIAEYLSEGSVQDVIQSRKLYKGDEDASLSSMLTIAASTAWGLKRAHDSNLIHCDVKPGNMLLTTYGIAKIADFGLAIALIGPDGSSMQKWMTEAFAAPEQIRCQALTPAVDVWGWAASMLSMFTGGVTWGSGAACGAALAEFMKGGGKAYRIPPMPESFAALLGECFRFSPDVRISNFEEIAERICAMHEEILGEPCPAQRPDLELVSADSLNNRAVSRLDLADNAETYRLLDEALSVDPLHPEANYNAGLLEYNSSGKVSKPFLDHLEQDAGLEPGEYRPRLYRACLLNLCGKSTEATGCLENSRRIANQAECQEIQRLWDLSTHKNPTPVLAPPISGEDFAQDSARFHRLMEKAEAAIREKRIDDANRYLLMSGDIPGFRRHPKRTKMLNRFGSLTILSHE